MGMGFSHLMDANDEDRASVGDLGGISGLTDQDALFNLTAASVESLGLVAPVGISGHCVLAGLGSIICF